MRILIAEDEQRTRQGLVRVLQSLRDEYEIVAQASNGKAALEMILEQKPDVVFIDIKMPFMDGLELSRLVKKALPQTKIIILSGYNEFDYAKEAIKIGISDYLLKPVTSANLIDALKKVAETIREEREKSKLLERYFVSYEKYTEFLDKTDYSGVDRKLIEDFLKLGSLDECRLFIEEYFAAVGENNYKSLLLRQYMVMDIFYCVQEFLKGINVNTDEIPPERKDIKLIPKAITNVETTLMYLTDLFIFALTMRDRASNDRYGTLIRDAKDYIAQNYSNSDFSLNMIATHIGVSPSYFSSIFKQETGQSFVEYLTKSRIDKACGLLKCTTLRTAEIGERVGYNDPHYFSSTFKKITGQSPKEFKAKEVKNES